MNAHGSDGIEARMGGVGLRAVWLLSALVACGSTSGEGGAGATSDGVSGSASNGGHSVSSGMAVGPSSSLAVGPSSSSGPSTGSAGPTTTGPTTTSTGQGGAGGEGGAASTASSTSVGASSSAVTTTASASATTAAASTTTASTSVASTSASSSSGGPVCQLGTTCDIAADCGQTPECQRAECNANICTLVDADDGEVCSTGRCTAGVCAAECGPTTGCPFRDCQLPACIDGRCEYFFWIGGDCSNQTQGGGGGMCQPDGCFCMNYDDCPITSRCCANSGRCMLETLPCPCGNGIIDAYEECDGANLGSSTCQSLGFVGGTLSCKSSCRLNTVACDAPEICDDDVDNDHDGTFDCGDADCANEPACLDPCGTVEIESGYVLSTRRAVALPDVLDTGCNPNASPELVVAVSPDQSGTLLLTGRANATNVVLSVRSTCHDPLAEYACIDQQPSGTMEKLRLKVDACEVYYVVVEANDPSLAVNATLGVEIRVTETCDDGIDNDDDNQVDCADLDCTGDVSCP